MQTGKFIELTNAMTGTRFLVWPRHFLIIQPQLTQIDLGKPLPNRTTLLSIFNPALTVEVKESYKEVCQKIGDSEK